MTRPRKTPKPAPSVLRSEIVSQPQVLQRILRRERKKALRLAQAIDHFDPQLVLIVGRGSADNAGLYGKYLFGAHNRQIVALATPSLITRYGAAPDLSRALVVAISQSGESYDVVETVEAARASGAMTVAVTNTEGSPLANAASEALLCHAGEERSVAATKTYTAQLYLLALLSAAMTGKQTLIDHLDRVPDAVRETLDQELEAQAIAERLRYLEQCAVVGRGFCYGSAFEIALKLAELTYVVAQPYSSADFRHGPIAVVDRGFCVLLLAPKGKVLPDLEELAVELGRRQAEVIAISNAAGLCKMATRALRLPSGLPEHLAPLPCVVPGQLLAMHLCRAKGLPLDTPRGLNKVTRTR
ncbi:MAG: glucosamine--fructose-6-phosphate aminotransferase [Proteobacteria bacterium]|nr:MAG: glucosamine--fructose-6-phosphate aminotransferase [Pseudomonadota bacterium]